ncbi:rhox homeobox family member 1-like [Mus pahari]|uniref:rhox homeobox family member 1-like n=1 Tax=Mus pahari TaxID=10093 RepID=UPI000A3119EF|nr:rhox homeobox family member 1-like [Mus pahari]
MAVTKGKGHTLHRAALTFGCHTKKMQETSVWLKNLGKPTYTGLTDTQAASRFDDFRNMERQSISYVLRIRPEDEGNANGVKTLRVLLAGEGRNEGESGRGLPRSGVVVAAAAAAAAAALSRQGGPATGAAGYLIRWTREGHGASRRVWENAQQLQQPVSCSMNGPRVAQPGPLPKGKCGSSNRFARWQLQELELVFQRTQYITAEDRKRLAVCLGVCEAKVRNWFQKRRAEYRKYHNP